MRSGRAGAVTTRLATNWRPPSAACQKVGVLEAELETLELGDYDTFCCMVDENLTQQYVGPKTIFEIVAAAIKEAERMLRSTQTVHEFNVRFERSRGLSSLLPKGHRPVPDKRNSWAPHGQKSEFCEALKRVLPHEFFESLKGTPWREFSESIKGRNRRLA